VPGADEGVKEKALCATHEVFEDRRGKRGRKIAIKIVIFPATGATKMGDPLFYIPGGPGSSATEDAPYIAQNFANIRKARDLVFVDQRGTGGSNPLNCTLFNPDDVRSFLGHYFPLEPVKKCREELELRADLRLYTTAIAMDDLDEVRAGLGYDKINMFGGSYGTRAALTYLKMHPKHVRAVVLHGVAPTDQLMPRDFPQDTERALTGVIAECMADAACRAAFPGASADARAVLERLLKGPVAVKVQGGKPGETIDLSRDLAAEAVRYMLYQSESAGRVPLFLHEAATGNFAPLANAALNYRRWIVATGSNGMYLSVTCAEDLPWIKPGVGERNAENTFLGGYRLVQQRAACALWPRGEIPSNYAEPTRSDVPVLITTGQWDPVTPPAHGDKTAKYLPNSLHVVVPFGGHGFNGLSGLGCIDNLIDSFIERGSVKGLDTSCVKAIVRKGFQLKLPPQGGSGQK
jgi:pimeloyl-ACP methyl ester carboxylesterase